MKQYKPGDYAAPRDIPSKWMVYNYLSGQTLKTGLTYDEAHGILKHTRDIFVIIQPEDPKWNIAGDTWEYDTMSRL